MEIRDYAHAAALQERHERAFQTDDDGWFDDTPENKRSCDEAVAFTVKMLAQHDAERKAKRLARLAAYAEQVRA